MWRTHTTYLVPDTSVFITSCHKDESFGKSLSTKHRTKSLTCVYLVLVYMWYSYMDWILLYNNGTRQYEQYTQQYRVI